MCVCVHVCVYVFTCVYTCMYSCIHVLVLCQRFFPQSKSFYWCTTVMVDTCGKTMPMKELYVWSTPKMMIK